MCDVVVIGAANMDIKAKLDSAHILATSNIGKVHLSVGGVGRNIAHNLASLGASVSLITVFGSDALGQALRHETKSAGVDISHAISTETATGTYTAILDHKGELITAVNDMRGISELSQDYLEKSNAALLSAKWIVADCNLELETLIYLAKNFGQKLIVEPVSIEKSAKLMTALTAAPIALATPNQAQLFSMTDREDLTSACAKIFAAGLQSLVVHCGEQGAALARPNFPLKKIPQTLVDDIIDVTGAGDASVAGIFFGLLNDYSLEKSVAFGQALARAVVQSEASVLSKSQATEIKNQP